MGLPYIKSLTVTADSGESNCIELPAPPRGQLERIIVKQTSGALDGYSFDVLDRNDACDSVSEQSSNPDDNVELLDKELHKVIPTQTVAATESTSENFFDSGKSYENQDERNVNTMRLNDALYMDLQPTTAGTTKTFQISYTILNPLH